MMCKQYSIILIAATFFFACQPAVKKQPPKPVEKIADEDRSLDTLPWIKPVKNEWISTRMYWGKCINLQGEIEPRNDSSLILEFKDFWHIPGANDDEAWNLFWICITDTSKLETGKTVSIPNREIYLRGKTGGPMMDAIPYSSLSGKIQLQYLRHDSCLVYLNITGCIPEKNGELQTFKLLSGKINYLINGNPDWEYNEKSDSIYWASLQLLQK